MNGADSFIWQHSSVDDIDKVVGEKFWDGKCLALNDLRSELFGDSRRYTAIADVLHEKSQEEQYL